MGIIASDRKLREIEEFYLLFLQVQRGNKDEPNDEAAIAKKVTHQTGTPRSGKQSRPALAKRGGVRKWTLVKP